MHTVCDVSLIDFSNSLHTPKLIYWLKDIIACGYINLAVNEYTSGYEAYLSAQLLLKAPLPSTALQRHWLGLPKDTQAWGTLQLVHWQVGRDEIVLSPQLNLQVTQAEHEAIEHDIAPLLIEDGFTLETHAPGVWHISNAEIAQLECAAPERAAGRDMRSFAPRAVNDEGRFAAKKWQRISNELQMLLYTHAVNEARTAERKLTLNAVWLSGCGALPLTASTSAPAKPSWAFERVNSIELLEKLISHNAINKLTLCSATKALTLEKRGFMQRLFKPRVTLQTLGELL